MDKWRKILSPWDEAQHEPVSVPPALDGLGLDAAVEKIQEWFQENFEDPVHSTPYDGGEGGYQYIWGGPYDAREIVEHVFDGIGAEVIEAAVGSIESESTEWVPSSNRRQPPQEDDPPSDDPATLHAELQIRLLSLEEATAALSVSPAGIGHNNPPEQIDPVPYTSQDQAEIVAAIGVLKAQPVVPVDEGKSAIEAAKVLEAKENTFRSWLKRQGDNFVTEFTKESGKQLATWGWPALFVFFVESLLHVSKLAAAWLASLGISVPF
jgi:hypothetical protein